MVANSYRMKQWHVFNFDSENSWNTDLIIVSQSNKKHYGEEQNHSWSATWKLSICLFLTGVKIDDDLGEWKTALTH